jgi:hypothetical protein
MISDRLILQGFIMQDSLPLATIQNAVLKSFRNLFE